MNTRSSLFQHVACVLFLLVAIQPPTSAQGTAFTYQGQLLNSGSPASGSYNMTFTLFTTNNGGTAVSGPLTNSAVAVTNGLFTMLVDFGPSVWNGQSNWLEIAVETNGGNGYATLSPRQQVTASPYAVYAEGANAAGISGTIPGATLGGTYSNSVTLNNPGNNLSGNGSGLANVNAAALGGLTASNFWQLGGNSVASGQFLGSTNNQAVEIWANKQRAFRVQPTAAGASLIGGTAQNSINSGVSNSFIGGGSYNTILSPNSVVGGGLDDYVSGTNSFVGGGEGNVIQDDHAFIGAGYNNIVNSSSVAGASDSFVGGGSDNEISYSGNSFIGGGLSNSLYASYHSVGPVQEPDSGSNSVIVGGWGNSLEVSSIASFIGGGVANSISSNAPGAFVGGGGYDGIQIHGNQIQSGVGASTIVGGLGNTIGGDGYYAFVGGGDLNSSIGLEATVAGGGLNTAGADDATVSGGNNNNANGSGTVVGGGDNNTAAADNSTVGGGSGNTAGGVFIGIIGGTLYYSYATVAGGQNNSATGNQYGYTTVSGGGGNNASEDYATVGGGQNNTAEGQGSVVSGGADNATRFQYSTVGGGENNSASVAWATVGGGAYNTAGNGYATVPGGYENIASGQYSLAAGQEAQATNQGAFVWADSQSATFSSTANDQFLIRAQGYVGINTNNPGAPLHVVGSRQGDSSKPIVLIENLDNTTSSSSALRVVAHGSPSQGALSVSTSAPSSGKSATNVLIAQFGNANAYVSSLDNNGNWTGTSFNSTSDRNAKENFSAISPLEILEKVTALPISRWNYKVDKESEHIGPMAQDFHAAFDVGLDDKHIATVDEDGVALAAIQGLSQKLEARSQELEDRSRQLETENAALREQNNCLAERLNQLETRMNRFAAQK